MHIYDFITKVISRIDEFAIGGTLPATEEYTAFIKNIHPQQLLNSRLVIPFYKVKYSYITARGNCREGEKYSFVTEMHDEVDMQIEMDLNDWAEEHNRKKPFSKISNVKILDIKKIAYGTIDISK